MKCHYEVLGVGRDANDTDIKTAYRKLALQWHPDKNLDQVEEAKEQFLLIQQAYETLSDPHERSWYDNHREQILRGKRSNYEDNSLDLFQYFTVSCFKGYGDDPGGFYGTYGEVFEKIRAEDAEFMDDEEQIETIPMFGDSKSSYEEIVGPFYAYWQSYCTKKSYAWLCPYDITEIKDRRVLREIEKETKKIVQKAKKERNEEVRNMVAFVRKRDKRVQANKKLLEERAAMNRLKQEQNRLEQIRRRQKELEEHQRDNQHTHYDNEEYEEQLRQLAQEYDDPNDEFTTEESSDEADELADSMEDVTLDNNLDELYCVACNKAFKNTNAFLNHETSRKHRDNVDLLKHEMLSEDQAFTADKDSVNVCDNLEDDEVGDNKLLTTEETDHTEKKEQKGKKNKKSRNRNKVVELQTASSDDDAKITDLLGDFATEKDEWSDEKKGKKGKAKRTTLKTVNNQTPIRENKSINAPPKVKEQSAPKEAAECDTDHCCVTCKSTFPSKNKLFQHLKATRHGVYISKTAQPADTDKKKSKRTK